VSDHDTAIDSGMNATHPIIAGTVGFLGAMSLSGCGADGGHEGACRPTIEINGKTYAERPTLGLERSGKLATKGIAPCSDASGSGADDESSAIELVSLQGVDTRIAVASARPTPGGGVYVIEGRCYGFRNAREIAECIKNPVHFHGDIFFGVKLRRPLTTEGPVGLGKIGPRSVRVWKITNVPVQHALAIDQEPRQIYVEVNRCNLNGLAPDFEDRLIRCLSSEPK
jgi:hypothetical protein